MGKCLSMCSTHENNINTSKSTSHENSQTVNVYQPTEKKTHPHPASLKDVDIPRSYMSNPELDDSKIQLMFDRYKDDSEDSILVSGMERFCQDLCVNPTEFGVLVLAWKFQASKMCRFTRKEFVEGCRLLKVDNLNSIKYSMADIEKEIRESEDDFRELYKFTFGFGLDVEEGQRNLPTTMAIPLWKLVFGEHGPAYLDKWCDYLEENEVNVVTRDTWNMFLHMAESIEPDFSNYDESEAWPSLFDDFVEAQRTSPSSN